jgi:hypothetical protein
MSAVMSRPLADYTSTGLRSIDELDAAICSLAKQMNIDCYRMLVLVREFDDRFGWMKWSFKNCSEWLAWRCSLKPSTAREKVRTAHALRRLPSISKAFAEGRLSYSKVRALTRVADRKICCSSMHSIRQFRTSRSGAGRFAMSHRSRPIRRGGHGRGGR